MLVVSAAFSPTSSGRWRPLECWNGGTLCDQPVELQGGEVDSSVELWSWAMYLQIARVASRGFDLPKDDVGPNGASSFPA